MQKNNPDMCILQGEVLSMQINDILIWTLNIAAGMSSMRIRIILQQIMRKARNAHSPVIFKTVLHKGKIYIVRVE